MGINLLFKQIVYLTQDKLYLIIKINGITSDKQLYFFETISVASSNIDNISFNYLIICKSSSNNKKSIF